MASGRSFNLQRMPPDQHQQDTAPLLPTNTRGATALTEQSDDGGKASSSFLPVIGLLIFGILAGWAIGHFDGSLLWVIPAIAIISGITHRRIFHFKKYLLHSIIRTSDMERIEGHMESTEWINLILERFWRVFEPQLSAQVIEKVNLIMDEQKPAFLNKLHLKEFTLGSNPPCVLGARAHQRTLPNIIHLDMDLCFYPAELSEESRQTIIRMRPSIVEEQPVQWNSKIVVVARIGKGIVGVDVPVMVKEVAIYGKLRVQLELMQEMPLLKQVQFSFLETPKIDFILRPLKALDLMDLPGLSNWMMSMINDNIEAQLVNPNRITINIAGQIEKIKTGVLKVKISSTQGITFPQDSEPFIKIELNGKARGKTAKATDGSSIHGRFFILTRALTKPILFKVMANPQTEIGVASYPLDKLVDKGVLDNLSADVIGPTGEVIGQVNFKLLYAMAADILDPEADLNSETGIFTVNIRQGQNLLPVGKTDRKLYVEGWIHSRKIEFDPTHHVYTEADPLCHRFPPAEAKGGEPLEWPEEVHGEWEVYIDRASKSQVTLLVKDAETDEIYSRWSMPVKKLLNRSDWFNTAHGDGKINLAFAFRPTEDGSTSEEVIVSEPSVGVTRLKLLGANGLEDKKSYYATVERNNETEIGRTGKSSETSAPVFNKTLIWPVAQLSDVARIEVYQKDLFKDPMVGALNVPLLYPSQHPNEDIQKEETLLDKKDESLEDGQTLKYEVGFYPFFISSERAALESSGSSFPIIPTDKPEGSNCGMLAIEEVSAKGFPPGQSAKDLFVVLNIEEDEQMLRTPKAQESAVQRQVTWKFYTEKFVREPEKQDLTIKLMDEKVIGGDDKLVSLTLDLSDAQAGYWYKTKSTGGIEIMIKGTFKPVDMAVPTEAENTGILYVNLQSASNLLGVDDGGKSSDPFAVFRLNSVKCYKSEVIKKDLSPVWDEKFEVEVHHRDRDVLNVDFRDWNRVAVSRTLGQVNLDLSQIPADGNWADYEFPLENTSTGTVLMRLKYEPKGLSRKVGDIVGAPAAAIASGVSAGAKAVFNPVSSLGSKIGDKFKSKDKDEKSEGSEEEGPNVKKPSKVGSFFGSVGDMVTGGSSKKEGEKEKSDAAATVAPTTDAPPQPAAGPKAPAAVVSPVAEEEGTEDEEEPILYIQFLDLKVSGISKPFDTRIKVRQSDKTIFKSDEIKNSTSPSFRAKPITETAFILPPADPNKPIRFALNWSAKSHPSTPEVIFDPESMNVIEEGDDSAIASLDFPLRGPEGAKAELVFKFAEADDHILKTLGKGTTSKMFSSLTSKMKPA